ncbi:MAG: TetR family transcriptional regulator [Hyphomicrobium sp.]|nr:TetR family transcriptional regulator [Hyphomicrobium sp.]
MTGRQTATEESDSKADATRERIVQAAIRLFSQKGYRGTSMGDLQKAVGLQRGGLYHHIANKEEILYDICRTRMVALVADTHRIMASEADPIKRTQLLGRAWLREIAAHREAWVILQHDSTSLNAERRAELRAGRDDITRCWMAVIHDGAASGQMRRIHPIALWALLGMFQYSALWFNSSGPLTADNIADVFVDLFLHGAGGDNLDLPRLTEPVASFSTRWFDPAA